MDDGNLTQEQMEKAAVALQKNKDELADKYIALFKRLNAQFIMHESKLPFRICRDIVENMDNSDEVIPGRYFPQPGPTWETQRYFRHPLGTEEMRRKERADPEAQRRRAEWLRRDRAEQWKDEEWARLFARFLLPYDFDTFKNTDWTGEQIEEETAELCKNFMKDIQNTAREHPDWFFLEPNPKKKWERICEFQGFN